MLRSLRTSLTVAAATAAASALAAGAAQAAVTAVAITSPSPVAIYPVLDESRPLPQHVEVGGTATGSGPVRFWCNGVSFDGRVVNGNALTSTLQLDGGPFTATVRINDLGSGVAGCRLVALPADGLPADLSPFTGPLLLRQSDNPETIAAGPNAGALSYFDTTFRQRRSEASFGGIALCGLCGLTYAEDDRQSGGAWWGAAWLNGYGTDPARTAATIDGRESFFADDVRNAPLDGYANWPAITGRQVTYPSDTGPGRLSASEAPVHCTTDPASMRSGSNVRLDPATCAAFEPAASASIAATSRSTPAAAAGASPM